MRSTKNRKKRRKKEGRSRKTTRKSRCRGGVGEDSEVKTSSSRNSHKLVGSGMRSQRWQSAHAEMTTRQREAERAEKDVKEVGYY